MALSKPTYQQTQKYPAWMDREAVYLGHQAGVYDASGNGTDFKVTAQGPAAMAVNIAVGRALVPQRALPPVSERAGFWATYSDAITSRTVANNSSGNPRIDQAILVQNDSTTGSAGDTTEIVIVPGTASVGATLDNRTGAVSDASLTTTYRNWLRLADLLVTNGAVSVSAAQIRDRRPWAMGVNRRIVRTSNASAGTDYSITATTATALDATNLAPRIESSGRLLRVRPIGTFQPPAGQTLYLNIRVDGAAPADAGDAVLNTGVSGPPSWEIIPAAGSHVIALFAHVSSGTGIIYAQATRPLFWLIEEDLRQNADNS